MTIRYANGITIEAALLSRDGNALRVASPYATDAIEFTNINGTWVSDDCEPVQIDFAWQRHGLPQRVNEPDCLCTPELAARLIHLLMNPAEEALHERIMLFMAKPVQTDAAAIV